MKTLFILLGTLSLGLGIIGIFVPLLPTTPFLLLTAALYVRSSPRLYAWLIANRYLGEYIRNYRENHAIPLRAKMVSLVFMWVTMVWCIFVLLTAWWWAQVALGVVLVGITWHILSFATLHK
ncbi:MAG: YbaN family protein [Alistipes sp.]